MSETSEQMQTAITVRHQLTHDAKTEWEKLNPTLLEGELVVVTEQYGEEDNLLTRTRLKIGDGKNNFIGLRYLDDDINSVLGVDTLKNNVSAHAEDNNVHFSSEDRVKFQGLKNYEHPVSGVKKGTYRCVSVNDTGHVTAGANPTTLAGYGMDWYEASFGDPASANSTETESEIVTVDENTDSESNDTTQSLSDRVKINLRGESYEVLTAHQDLSSKVNIDGGDVTNTVVLFTEENPAETQNQKSGVSKPPLNIGESAGETPPSFPLYELFSRIKYWFAKLHEVAFSGKYADLESRPSLMKTITITGDATGTADTAAVTDDEINAEDYSNTASVQITLVNTGVEDGTYGPAQDITLVDTGSFQVPTYAVDLKGRLVTSETNTIQLKQTPHVYVDTFAESDWTLNSDLGKYVFTLEASAHSLQGMITCDIWGVMSVTVDDMPVYGRTYAAMTCGFAIDENYNVVIVSDSAFAGRIELTSGYSTTVSASAAAGTLDK